MRLLEYMYYKYFLFFNEVNPEMSSFLAKMGLWWTLLMIFVICWGGTILYVDINVAYASTKWHGLLVGTTFFTFNFLYFSARKHSKIVQKYSAEKNPIIGSLFVFFVTMVIFAFNLLHIVPELQRVIWR